MAATKEHPLATLFHGGVLEANCPSRVVLDHVTSKWGVLVLVALDDRTLRWSELRRTVEGVSEKMLAQSLQTLERDGWVHREVRSAIPPHVEYRLTDAGTDLVPHLLGLIHFVEDRLPAVRAAQAAAAGDAPPR